MDGLRNHGSEPDLTRSGTGYCMTRKKPFLPGEDIVQSGQFQVCVEAVFCNESCTMALETKDHLK